MDHDTSDEKSSIGHEAPVTVSAAPVVPKQAKNSVAFAFVMLGLIVLISLEAVIVLLARSN